MKKFNLSLVAVLAMSTFAIAGGDIAPVEPVIETPMVEESTPGNFYLGLGYGMANVSGTDTISNITDVDYSTVLLQAGYKFNPYIALEGRYWIGLDEDVTATNTLTLDTWGIYAKPMYPVTDAFDIYALLGYASSDIQLTNGNPADNTDGFSWGIGGAYSFTENVAVFVDYTSMYDDSQESALNPAFTYNYEITAVNFGVTYQF